MTLPKEYVVAQSASIGSSGKTPAVLEKSLIVGPGLKEMSSV